LRKFGVCIVVGVAVYFVGPPAGVEQRAWHLFAIFLATILGIILQPLPLGAVALVGLCAAMLTGTLPFKLAFSEFASSIPWLIAIAFFLSLGFVKTGLGFRVAYMFVSVFGSTTLGLTYALVFAEAMISPAIPSVAARAGGIMLPIIKSLCASCGSNVGDGTERKLGAYLMVTCFHTSCVSSSMFLTSMAANPLAAKLAEKGTGIKITWGSWAVAAVPPGLIALILVPLVLYVVFPPEVKKSPEAPADARQKLAAMGPMSAQEKIMAASLSVTVVLWILGQSIGVHPIAAALVGLSVMLIFGVVTWKECLSETTAWDTLVWFGALVAMANYLNEYGLIKWFSDGVTEALDGLGLPWFGFLLILLMVYFYSHYLFASSGAHIGAMYAAFLSVGISLNAPKQVASLAFAVVSSPMGGLTHYGIGSAPPLFGAGFVDLPTWWKLGLLVSTVNFLIYVIGGLVWWKVIGLW